MFSYNGCVNCSVLKNNRKNNRKAKKNETVGAHRMVCDVRNGYVERTSAINQLYDFGEVVQHVYCYLLVLLSHNKKQNKPNEHIRQNGIWRLNSCVAAV